MGTIYRRAYWLFRVFDSTVNMRFCICLTYQGFFEYRQIQILYCSLFLPFNPWSGFRCIQALQINPLEWFFPANPSGIGPGWSGFSNGLLEKEINTENKITSGNNTFPERQLYG